MKNSVSNRALTSLQEVMYDQDEFGIKKYDRPLRSSYNYDWLAMMEEEMADFLKYFQCEKERKREVTNLLSAGLELKEWSLVEDALKLLEIHGTGDHK